MSMTATTTTPTVARGPKPQRLTPGRIGIYVFLFSAAAFFLLPLFIMVVTSMKTLEEIRQGSILALPMALNFDAWVKAWTQACTGLECHGIQVGFWNSVKILIPSVIISIVVGAINGYALTFWKRPGSNLLFAVLMVGAFIPYQVFLNPMIRFFSFAGLYSSLPGIILVHVIFGMPVMTMLFRNFYANLPVELFHAARVDGAGFWRIFFDVILPMSAPIFVVAAILQVTGIWNDFLLGLVFAGRENLPMTVQLNNVVNTTTGEREYNVNMAATLLTALVPTIVYFVSGRWFVRGIASGAVKG